MEIQNYYHIFFPGKQGIYLENGIRPPSPFYKLDKFFDSFSMANLWLPSRSFVRAILCRVLVT